VRYRRTTATALLIAISLAACHRGANDATKAAKAQLEARLLTIVDLPSVYSTAQANDDGGGGSSRCRVGDADANRVATARAAFTEESTKARLQETLSRYSASGATNAVAAVRQLPRKCPEVAASSIRTRIAAVTWPRLLDETAAVRLTVDTGNGESSVFVAVVMRRGNDVAELIYGGVAAVDDAVVRDLADRAAKKLD
jgi:hypothetical protein